MISTRDLALGGCLTTAIRWLQWGRSEAQTLERMERNCPGGTPQQYAEILALARAGWDAAHEIDWQGDEPLDPTLWPHLPGP